MPPPYPTGGKFARFTRKDPITSRGAVASLSQSRTEVRNIAVARAGLPWAIRVDIRTFECARCDHAHSAQKGEPSRWNCRQSGGNIREAGHAPQVISWLKQQLVARFERPPWQPTESEQVR